MNGIFRVRLILDFIEVGLIVACLAYWWLDNLYGKPFSQKSLTNHMAVWCEQAGIPPGYTLHGLRSTFANKIAEGGADPFAVQKALGHRNFRTTQIYLKKLDATPMAVRAADAAARRVAQIRRIRDSEK